MADRFNLSDVMISYSRRDKTFVQKLERAIKKTGRETWVDWDDIPPTVDWWQEIQAGIEAAHTFVFVISPNSVRSDVCYQEIEHAVLHHKRIIPVLYQEITDPADKERVHPVLSAHNWIFFRPEDDTRSAFRTLMHALATDFEYVRQHTRLLVLANEWLEGQRKASLLLRGDDLRNAETWLQAATNKDPAPTTTQIDYLTASRQGASRLTRIVGMITGIIMVVLAGLTLFALAQSQVATQSLSDLESAVGEVSTQQARLAELDATVAGAERVAAAAGETQIAAVATQAAAQTLGAAAGSEAQTAQAAQLTASADQQTAQAAQQAAQAAQATSDADLRTSQAEQATIQAEAATAAAGQSTASVAQQTAQAAEATSQAAAELAATQQAEADALRQTAEAAEMAANVEAGQARENAAAAATLAAQQELAAQTAAAAAAIAATQAAEQEFAAQTAAANAQTEAARAASEAARAATEAARAATEAARALTESARAVTEAARAAIAATEAAQLSELNDTTSLMQEAQRQLGLGNRPLAVHLALQAVDRPERTLPLSPEIEADFYEVVYSTGSQWEVTAEADGDVTQLAFRPDGTQFASVSFNSATAISRLVIRDTTNGAVIGDPMILGNYYVEHIAYHPNGSTIAVATDGGLQLWDLQAHPRVVTTYNYPYSGSLSGIAFSTDGAFIIGARRRGKVWIVRADAPETAVYTIETGEFIRSLALRPDPDNRYPVEQIALGVNNQIKIWEFSATSAPSLAHTLSGSEQDVNVLAYHTDGTRLLSTNGSIVRHWHIANGNTIEFTQPETGFYGIAFTPDGSRYVAAGYDGVVYVREIYDRYYMQYARNERYLGHTSEIYALAVNPHNGWVISGDRSGRIRAWYLDQDLAATSPLPEETVFLEYIDFCPDGSTVVTHASQWRLWSISTRSVSLQFSAPTWPVCVGERLLFTNNQGLVTLDMDGQTIHLAAYPNTYAPILTHSPQANMLVTGNASSSLTLWSVQDPDNPQILRTLPSVNGFVGVAISPDGASIVTLADYSPQIAIRDAQTAELLRTWDEGIPDNIAIMRLAPDGMTMVLATSDGYIYLWNLATMQQIGVFNHSASTVLNDVAISSDGRYLAAASENGNIYIWDLTSRVLVVEILGHYGIAWSLDFHPNNRQIASSGRDGTIRIWNIPTFETARNRACGELYVQPFTAEQLAVYDNYGVTGNHSCADVEIGSAPPPAAPAIVTVTPAGYIPVPPTLPLPASPTPAPSATPTATVTLTATATTSATITAAPLTPTVTASPTLTVTTSPTPTVTVSPTPTVTVSPTPTVTVSPTPTVATSPTLTVTAAPPTLTATVSPTP